MKNRLIAAAILLTTTAPGAYAQKSKAEKLVDGCAELISMYDKKDKKLPFTGFTTSSSEAFLAGYCRGSLQESKPYRCNKRWYERAEFIASFNGIEQKFSLSSLLSRSCHE